MVKRILPTFLPGFVLTLVVSGGLAATAVAGTGSTAACPPPETSTSGVPISTAESIEPTDRCAIDAEAYFREYQEADVEMTTTALPASTGGPTNATPGIVAEYAPPVPPIVIDEPGVLDDNTFVDSGDSLWVTTDDDRESTFALDVDTGSFDVAQTFLANGYRPEPDSIRVEEWINAFTYGDAPATDADLAVTVESAATRRGRHGSGPRRRHVPTARRRGSAAGQPHLRHRHVRLDGHP